MDLYLRFLILMNIKQWINWLKKDTLFELVIWVIIMALITTGFYSWHKITTWSEATVNSLKTAVAAPAASSGPSYVAPAPEPAQAVVVSRPGDPQHIVREGDVDVWYGTASWYDYSFYDGEKFGRPCYRDREDCWTEDQLVAASRDYPRGTELLVTNLNTDKSVVITVRDFGPEEALHPGRIIDLSSYAFAAIAGLNEGLIEVSVEEFVLGSADGGGRVDNERGEF